MNSLTRNGLNITSGVSKSFKEKKNEEVRTLIIFLNESQRQYSECFAEAAKQDSLLEVQRDSIESLQQKIICKESNLCKIILLHCIYSAYIFHLQEQLKIYESDCEALKLKIERLKRNNKSLEEKYLSATCLWKETVFELNQLKNTNKFETKSTECNILQRDYDLLMEKNVDLQRELEKHRIDFEFIEQEFKKQNKICRLTENLQTELYEVLNLKSELETENENLRIELKKYKVEFEMIQEELKHLSTEYIPKLRSDLENLDFQKQTLTSDLEETRNQNERLMDKLKSNDENEDRLNERISELESNQQEMIEKLKAKVLSNEQETENYISELNNSEIMSNFLKKLLEEKSDCMAKLQAAYQVMKNNNTILKTEYEKLEIKGKEDICELQSKNREIQLQLGVMENNYETVTQDFNKSQEFLSISVKREVELQQMLTNLEKKFYSRIINMEEEETRLKELLKNLKKELEYEKKEVSSKKVELEKIQSACNLFSNQLEETQSQLENQKKNNSKLQSSFKKKLQESREENCQLLRKIQFLEQNNNKSNNQLGDMHNILVDLKQECKMKNKSLASISAELTEATASRSELCNESQYVVSCIREWMEEQNNLVDSLNKKLKSKQEQLEALVTKVKEQKRIINRIKRKRLRICCNRNYSNLRIFQTQSEPSSTHLLSKKYFTERCKKSEYWSSAFFHKIKHLTKALKQGNEFFHENSTFHSDGFGFDENRDCGYQSSTSK